jgi:hypothetical protein
LIQLIRQQLSQFGTDVFVAGPLLQICAKIDNSTDPQLFHLAGSRMQPMIARITIRYRGEVCAKPTTGGGRPLFSQTFGQCIGPCGNCTCAKADDDIARLGVGAHQLFQVVFIQKRAGVSVAMAD